MSPAAFRLSNGHDGLQGCCIAIRTVVWCWSETPGNAVVHRQSRSGCLLCCSADCGMRPGEPICHNWPDCSLVVSGLQAAIPARCISRPLSDAVSWDSISPELECTKPVHTEKDTGFGRH